MKERFLSCKLLSSPWPSVRVRDRISSAMMFSDQELLLLSDTDQLWRHINPSGRRSRGYPVRRVTGHMRSFFEREMAVGLLGPRAVIDAEHFLFPPEKFEPLRSRLYNVLIRRFDVRASLFGEQPTEHYYFKYAVDHPVVPYCLSPDRSVTALYESELLRSGGSRCHQEVAAFFAERKNVSVLDIGIGRSHIIEDVSRRLKTNGVRTVDRYGIALSMLERMPRLSAPCYVGEFETFDFNGQRFDLLFSNVGAAYYTLRPAFFLEKLVSIMNDGAYAWLHVYSLQDWSSVLQERNDISFTPLKSLHDLAKAFELVDSEYITDTYMHEFYMEPKVVLLKRI